MIRTNIAPSCSWDSDIDSTHMICKHFLNNSRRSCGKIKRFVYFSYRRIAYVSLMGCSRMAVSYNKLWKLMIDQSINKTQLCKKARISTNAMAKLGRNEDVRVDVLTKICVALNCSMDDIMDIIPDAE